MTVEKFKCIRCGCNSFAIRNLMDDLQGYCNCNACGFHHKSRVEMIEITQDLYTPNDIKKVREQLAKEQDYKDLITGTELRGSRPVVDHAHDSDQYVRGVLLHTTNTFVGNIENAYKRHMAWWLDELTLSDLLRNTAEYLERPPDKRFRHNGWIRVVQIAFNKASAKQQNAILEALGESQGGNLAERKKLLKKAILKRQHGYEEVLRIIKNV